MNTATETGLSATQIQHLEEEGYTVVPGFLDRGLTARLRQHIDSLCPPVGSSERKTLDLRAPIPGAIMVEALFDTGLIPLAETLLQSRDVRLLEQVLIRTDPSPATMPAGPSGWHLDMAFAPEEFHARPRRTYYHHVHALSTVEPGGGAFTIVPRSHHLTYAASGKFSSDDELKRLKEDPVGVAGIDVSKAIEVCPTDGDLLIFNPMCLHSASCNRRSEPRYVYFASFMDSSAKYLKGCLHAMKYKRPFAEELVRGLPAGYAKLLEW